MAVEPGTGDVAFEWKMDGPPIFDGLSAAPGCLLLALADGSVVCLTPEQ